MPLNKVSRYNYFFLIPYLLWIMVGGILLFFFDKQVLFAMVNTHHTAFADIWMYNITWMGEGVTITLLLISLLAIRRLRNWSYFFAAALCNILPSVVTQIIKHLVNAPRPLNYFHKAVWVHVSPEWPVYMDYSFPSGHTTGAFGFFCFVSMLLPVKYHTYGILFFLLAMSVAYSRLYLAAHFFADVYVGSIIGGSISLITFIAVNRNRQFAL